jgi:hypothetical protein
LADQLGRQQHQQARHTYTSLVEQKRLEIDRDMETIMAGGRSYGGKREEQAHHSYFVMPLHYPRYSKEEYEGMPEWQLDRLLSEYGLPVTGTLHQKRTFAMAAFLWGGGGVAH